MQQEGEVRCARGLREILLLIAFLRRTHRQREDLKRGSSFSRGRRWTSRKNNLLPTSDYMRLPRHLAETLVYVAILRCGESTWIPSSVCCIRYW